LRTLLIVLGFVCTMFVANISYAQTTLNPLAGTTTVRVFVQNWGPLGRQLAEKYGDSPVSWCGGLPAKSCGSQLVDEIHDPQVISKLVEFANKRLDLWNKPWPESPMPEVTVGFFDAVNNVGTIGSGPNFFMRDGLTRQASGAELREFLNLVGILPSSLKNPP
jgi:hypothetical protein